MLPAIAAGDWLLVDPLVAAGPARAPSSSSASRLGEALAIKRVAGRGGDRVRSAAAT